MSWKLTSLIRRSRRGSKNSKKTNSKNPKKFTSSDLNSDLDYRVFEGTNTREESARLIKQKKRELREKFLARYSKNLGKEGKKSFKVIKKGPTFKPPKLEIKDYHLCPDAPTLKALTKKKKLAEFKTEHNQILEDTEIFTEEEKEQLENLEKQSF